MTSPPIRLRRDQTQLLIVDVQERLLPAMHEADATLRACQLLARAAVQLKIPIVIAEQYPEKLGATVAALREIAPHGEAISKMAFSSVTQSTLSVLRESGRRTILLCGIESHVCVLQSALDLIENDFTVFVARDAISSRRRSDCEIGWARMMREGAIATSSESAVFELLQQAGTSDFKALLPFIK